MKFINIVLFCFVLKTKQNFDKILKILLISIKLLVSNIN